MVEQGRRGQHAPLRPGPSTVSGPRDAAHADDRARTGQAGGRWSRLAPPSSTCSGWPGAWSRVADALLVDGRELRGDDDSSARPGSNSCPASMTGRSMVRAISSPIGANPNSPPAAVQHERGPLTGNSVRTDLGQGADLVPVETGLVRQHGHGRGQRLPHSRSNAVCPRRAPAVAVSTVAVASATSRASTSSDRQRRRNSRRSQVRTICTGPSRWPAPSRPQECYSDPSE